MAKKQKRRGPKFKKRRAFDREAAFPKRAAQEKMAEEMRIYQNLVIGINRAFPDRAMRIAYMEALIEGLAVEDEDDGDRSETEVGGDQDEVGEGKESEEVIPGVVEVDGGS
jgi:Ran GTPase-activating protein (RanGAP) involved in mRNA processing and transport